MTCSFCVRDQYLFHVASHFVFLEAFYHATEQERLQFVLDSVHDSLSSLGIDCIGVTDELSRDIP